jgi:hypothetical protein
MFRYVLLWFALLVVAVGNGALREATFARTMPELRAHQLSTVIGSLLVGALICAFIHFWPPSSSFNALMIGFVWLCLTVAFEFFMGFVLRKRPIGEILADYDLFAGRIWVLFLVWLTVAPWLFYRLAAND